MFETTKQLTMTQRNPCFGKGPTITHPIRSHLEPPKPSRMDKLILLESKSTDSMRTFTSWPTMK